MVLSGGSPPNQYRRHHPFRCYAPPGVKGMSRDLVTITPNQHPARPGPAAPAEPTARRRLVVLGLVLTAQLMVVLDTTIVNIALPDIATALDFSPTGLAWVITAYTLVFGGLLLLGARAGDILGRRRVFIAGHRRCSASPRWPAGSPPRPAC